MTCRDILNVALGVSLAILGGALTLVSIALSPLVDTDISICVGVCVPIGLLVAHGGIELCHHKK